jgi:hypothetical protein
MAASPVLSPHPHPNQVAGHGELLCGQTENGKKVVYKPAVPQEVAFYEAVEKNEHFATLSELVPKYYGTVEGPKGEKMVAIEDLTAGFQKPCVMDVKIGTFWHADDMEQNDNKKATNSVANLGVRICGGQIYKTPLGNYEQKGKDFGKIIKKESQIKAAIREFFDNGERLRLDALEKTIRQVKKIIDSYYMFRWRFISSSVLVVYDGIDSQCKVKMIDFAHAFPSDSPEIEPRRVKVGYLCGIRSLLKILEEIQAEEA